MSQTGDTLCRNPADNAVLGSSPLSRVEEVSRIVSQAREGQAQWAAAPLKERVTCLKKIRAHLLERADKLAAIISQDNGKTRIDAMTTEILPAAMAISYYMKKAPAFLKTRRLAPGAWILANKRPYLRREPWGVIAVISPWNYPFAIPFSEVVMGLLAGNAVILKTATQTQTVGRALEECFLAGGMPDGVFRFLNLPGSQTGDALLEAGVDKLFFTGSVEAGKKLMAKAAESLTPLSLELGGNDPMIVLAEADLDRAAAGAVWAGLSNCGQSCGGVERVYVMRQVYEPFLEKLCARVENLRIGQDLDFRVDLGAMTTKKQADKVRRQVEEALSQGASIRARGRHLHPSRGNFSPALVLTDVNHQMEIMRQETFGPVLCVMAVEDEDQAIALANDSNLGLTASVWSRKRKQARQLAARIQAGVVTVNDHLMSHGLPGTPWGGFKQSGLGRTHGALGFDEMTKPQCLVDDILPGVKKNLWWHPHGPGIYLGHKGIMEFLYGPGLGRRFIGMISMLKMLPRIFKS